MEPRHHTLRITLYAIEETYWAELVHTRPDSDTQVAPVRERVAFERVALRGQQLDPEAYGEELSRQLFRADGAVRESFLAAETAADSTNSCLRVCICIDPSARELQSLHWELLRHPKDDRWLCTSERLLLSRFMVSRDQRPVQVRARAELTALVAISAPNEAALQRWQLAPVDFAGEVARAQAALRGMKEVRTLGGAPGRYFTLNRLIEELGRDVDVLYLVSHGKFATGEERAALILQDEQGEVRLVTGDELAERIADLADRPRLVVLASCQSAGDGEIVEKTRASAVQASLAGRLADAGVPAILAMQGFISMLTVETLMPAFFDELLGQRHDGQIDGALAAARGRVLDRPDWWMPTLSTRLTTGRLWYRPGFRSAESQKTVWERLIPAVRRGEVVPILGPRLLEPVYGGETARRLAEAKQFPFAEHVCDDLPRVSQFILIDEKVRGNLITTYRKQLIADLIAQNRGWLPAGEIPPGRANPRLSELLRLVGEHQRKHDPIDAYSILARLPARVYLTTQFEPLLEHALAATVEGGRTKRPQSIVSRWREGKAQRADKPMILPPCKEAPVVYHAFGMFGLDPDDGSLVLTQDDYFDSMIANAADQLMPDEVAGALCANSLLFLGFRLTDWHFHVLFRIMMNLEGRDNLRRFCHVAVQLDPDTQTMRDVERGKQYLARYFGRDAPIEIYWGDAPEFLKELDDQLAREDVSGAW